MFWAERSARLKLKFPVGDKAEFEVPGARIKREANGEVPGGKWVAVNSKFGFASNALYNFDCRDGALSATVVRGTRYATESPHPSEGEPWIPTTDLGELKFRFLMTAQIDDLPGLALELEQPPVVLLVPQEGKAGSSGFFGFSKARLPPVDRPQARGDGFWIYPPRARIIRQNGPGQIGLAGKSD